MGIVPSLKQSLIFGLGRMVHGVLRWLLVVLLSGLSP